MTTNKRLLDLESLKEDMLAFERKYGLRSETVYAAYVNGEESEDGVGILDFGEWATVYKTWLELKNAAEVERLIEESEQEE